jgi:hypothetical protein
MASKKWDWRILHLLDGTKYELGERGKVTSATLTNAGEISLHVYGYGIEFEWQRDGELWWPVKSDISLQPSAKVQLPSVGFHIPIDLEPGVYKYRVGVRTRSRDETTRAEWKDHGIVWASKEYELRIIPHVDRNYEVFFSHSNHSEDGDLVKALHSLLANNGIGCFIAEQTPKYGEILWKKIRSGIGSADRVLVLWTKHGAKSGDVREELGITVGARKRFIPIVEKGAKLEGSLIGTEYLRFERHSHRDVFVGLTENLIEFSSEKAKRLKEVALKERRVSS